MLSLLGPYDDFNNVSFGICSRNVLLGIDFEDFFLSYKKLSNKRYVYLRDLIGFNFIEFCRTLPTNEK